MEYWITDDNDLIYCDGDGGIDVPNHSMVAQSYALQKVISTIEENKDRHAKLAFYILKTMESSIEHYGEYDTTGIRSDILMVVDHLLTEKIILEKHADDIFTYMSRTFKVPRHLLDVAFDHSDIDGRQYAVKHWNWIRVIENNFDIHKITKTNCEKMFDFAIEHSNFSHWNIEVATLDKYIRRVQLNELVSPSTLRNLSRG